ncbi:MAG: glutamine-hydrolyzing GMP synthase [Candidatus Peregrinibacteria bacterium]
MNANELQILIVDLGSQYTRVIGRTLRELGYRSIILPPDKATKWLTNFKSNGIILSGGSASVYQDNAPKPPSEILTMEVPILGICYGMQWLARCFGGQVEAHRDKREYGKAMTHFKLDDPLFQNLKNVESIVWASHGDSVSAVPDHFKIIATPGGDVSTHVLSGMDLGVSAMSNMKKRIWGVQFHPEVTHTLEGKTILRNFIEGICGCSKDWWPKDLIHEIQSKVKLAVGNKRAIIGFSGGVDSTTLTTMLEPILGKNLLAVAIDIGALREGELDEIRFAAKAAGVRLKIVRAAGRFQKAIGHATDAEVKRKIFSRLYSIILDEEAKIFGADFIIQGTLATDLIESSKSGEAAHIKSHHNAIARFKSQQIHPLRELFKYEIRDLAKILGLPEQIVNRQPFPGPGLNLRVVGIPPTREKIAVVRWADAKVTSILKKHKLMGKISQLVVALLGVPVVGIKGDARTYKYIIAVRGVVSNDFMTCEGFQIPKKVRAEITSEITKHPEVVQVGFFETNKPPATTEFE